MRDFYFHDQCGVWRRRWTLRIIIPRIWRWWFNDLWAHERSKYSDAIECSVANRYSASCCCPSGRQTHIRMKIAGFGFMLWCDRDRIASPCLCDLALMEAFPDEYADCIAELPEGETVKSMIDRRMKWNRRIMPAWFGQFPATPAQEAR